MKKIIWLFYIVLFISVSCLFLNSCKSKEKNINNKKIILILFDQSMSVKNDEMFKTFICNFNQIEKSINPGDVLIAGMITERSIAELELPINHVFPEFHSTTNNELYGNAEKTLFDSVQLKVKDSLRQVFDSMVHQGNRVILKTDIFSSLQLAEKIFKSYTGYRNVLVLMSDMLEDAQGIKFVDLNLNQDKINQIINLLKKKNEIPDLAKVKVYVSNAYSDDIDRFNQVKNFWFNYFKLTNADLQMQNYNAALIKFDE